MKKLICFLLILIIVMSTGSVVSHNCAYAAPSIEKQYKLIYDSFDLWDMSDYTMGTAYYAVTDLDSNGRLEVIAAMNYGTGGHTHLRLYEVNEDCTGLNPLGSGFDLDAFSLTEADLNLEWEGYRPAKDEALQYWEDYYSPDLLIKDSMEIPYFIDENDECKFIVNNYYNEGQDYEETVIESISLSNGELSLKPIVTYIYDFFSDNKEQYFDGNNNAISKKDYENWESVFDRCGGSVTFERFYEVTEDAIRHSYKTFVNQS